MKACWRNLRGLLTVGAQIAMLPTPGTECLDQDVFLHTDVQSRSHALQPTRSPEHDHLCLKAAPFGYQCISCSHNAMCLQGRAFVIPCAKGTTCSQQLEAFGGSVCHTHSSQECSCLDTVPTRPDPYDPQYYLVCKDGAKTPQVLLCPDQQEYDMESARCQPMPLFPSCKNKGTFSNTFSCRWYYECVPVGQLAWLQRRRRCPHSGLVYSQSANACLLAHELPAWEPCSAARRKKNTQYRCTLLALLLWKLYPPLLPDVCTVQP
ncbi:uncharacterized protein LOC143026894 [Oratosquilla oratoria]|uniref:uncharacterized protein LOC143026894 n=1 Tax=Oratosquilla oratoria TaxID=337810 RepID=UPI003F75D533